MSEFNESKVTKYRKLLKQRGDLPEPAVDWMVDQLVDGATHRARDFQSEFVAATLTQQKENCVLLRRQASRGFLSAQIAMAIGTGAVLAGAIGLMFGLNEGSAALTTSAGIVINVVSALQRRSATEAIGAFLRMSDKLQATCGSLAAIAAAGTLSEDQRDKIVPPLLRQLAGLSTAS